MAMSAGRIITRKWWGVGVKRRPIKKQTFGFSVQVDGKQIRRFDSAWGTAEEAAKGLAAFRLGLAPKETAATPSSKGMTFGQATERYLQEKSRKKSHKEDKRICEVLKREFGSDTHLSDLSASRISAYKAKRLATISRQSGAGLSAASINRPLALLRHLLRLAHEEWEVLAVVPRIRLEKEPQGRIRWLEPDEEQRLLKACQASPNPWVHPITACALESGCRRAELLGLTWDRVDLSRGVIRLEITKSGRRREVPMRQVVYDILAGLPGPREGRVWPVRTIRKAFEQAVKAAKLDAEFRFHDTRHHFASWWVMNGGSLPALQQILGHKTLAMTMRYSHLSHEHLRAEVAKTERGGSDQHMISTKLVESPATVA